jgi:hypothetical protein
VTSAEKAKLTKVAAGCTNSVLRVHKATVTYQ